MGLGFCRACADRPPADHVGHIFRGDRIEHLIGHRHLKFGYPQQKAPGNAESFGDEVGAVHVGIIDQPFPTDRGARLFKVDPHNQHQLVVNTPRKCCQPPGVVDGGIRVMDGAGPDDNHQAFVTPLQDIFQVLAAPVDELGVSR